MHHRPFLLSDALRGVRRRKWLVAFVFCAVLLGVGAATILTEKSYNSEARLFLRLGRENAALDATATLGEHPVVMMPQSRQAEINSVVELLQAKQIYQAVVDELGPERILASDHGATVGPERPPQEQALLSRVLGGTLSYLASIGVLNDLPAREKAVIKLQKKVDVESFEDSNVITISFESYSPETAQAVVESLVRRYIQEHIQLHRAAGIDQFLTEETNQLHERLVASQRELESLKRTTGVLSSDLHRAMLVDQLGVLERESLQAVAEASALRAEVDELTRGLSELTRMQTVSETVGAGNQGADGMRQELFRLELAYQELLSTYSSSHPKVKQAAEQLLQSREMLKAAEADRHERVQGPNQVYQETSVALTLKRPALAAAEARVKKLSEQIAQFQEGLNRFTEHEFEFARLDREIAILDNNYRRYAVNLQQSHVDEKMQAERFTNISIAQPASLNLKPTKPNKLVNLLLGLILGVTGGVSLAALLEYRNPAMVTDLDIASALGADVVATVPWLPEGERLPATADSSGRDRAAAQGLDARAKQATAKAISADEVHS